MSDENKNLVLVEKYKGFDIYVNPKASTSFEQFVAIRKGREERYNNGILFNLKGTINESRFEEISENVFMVDSQGDGIRKIHFNRKNSITGKKYGKIIAATGHQYDVGKEIEIDPKSKYKYDKCYPPSSKNEGIYAKVQEIQAKKDELVEEQKSLAAQMET